MVFMKRRIKMATKKKQASDEELKNKQQEMIEQQNKIRAAYEQGKAEAQQEVWKAVSKFLKERMLAHFMNKNNEIAKELREINEIISKNIT